MPDEAFASGAMGSGYAVVPADNKVYAPFDGTVVTVANSRHAVAMVSDDGVELLIHMGINTVKLKGAPFELKVQENDVVQKGQLLAIVDWNMIRDNQFEVTTPVIVTNTAEHESVELKADRSSEVMIGELVLSIR
ncbi:PTS system glucoside-specific EIICBA component [compost metagenome]